MKANQKKEGVKCLIVNGSEETMQQASDGVHEGTALCGVIKLE